MEVLVSCTSRGLAPREGLGLLMSKLGHTRPSMELHRGPQVDKSGYPISRTPTVDVASPLVSSLIAHAAASLASILPRSARTSIMFLPHYKKYVNL